MCACSFFSSNVAWKSVRYWDTFNLPDLFFIQSHHAALSSAYVQVRGNFLFSILVQDDGGQFKIRVHLLNTHGLKSWGEAHGHWICFVRLPTRYTAHILPSQRLSRLKKLKGVQWPTFTRPHKHKSKYTCIFRPLRDNNCPRQCLQERGREKYL